MTTRRARVLLVLAALCLATTALARERGTPRRLDDIDTIVVHAVAGPSCVFGLVIFGRAPQRDDDAEYWRTFMRAAPEADAHFVIGRAGTTLDIIPIDQVANHTKGVNARSIGIELVNAGDGTEPFPQVQVDSLVTLIRDLRRRAPGITSIVTHSDIDQRTCPCGGKTYHRRQDPGPAFPMQTVRAAFARPGETMDGASLPRLTGPAPPEACS